MANMKLLLSALVAASLILSVSAHCCGYDNTGHCADGTGATPCCGVGKCNFFCCNCDGGCRASPNPPEPCSDCVNEYNGCWLSVTSTCDPEDPQDCSYALQACKEAETVCFQSCSNGLTSYNNTVHNYQICDVKGEGQQHALLCPRENQQIARIDFASYGTPVGTCGTGFTQGSCHSITSQGVAAKCLGKSSCSTHVANFDTFSNDPCVGTQKNFAVQATCQVVEQACTTQLESSQLSLRCPNPTEVITSVDFASYGTPSGLCGLSFNVGSCHSSNSVSVIETACLGKNSCDPIVISNANFGGDPCGDVPKTLAAKVTCKIPL